MVNCKEEVQLIGKKLEKVIAGKKEKTRIGMVINALRKKTTDEVLSKKSKLLIRNWKNLVDDKGHNNKTTTEIKKSKSISEEGVSNVDAAKATEDNNDSVETKKAPPTIPNTNFNNKKFNLTNDPVRLKSIEMIRNALTFGELPQGTLSPNDLAEKIEYKLYEVHRDTNEKYKSALRSRVFNLRDKKNLALRENVLTGAIPTEKFAVMTAEEMASDEVKKMRNEFTKESILEHQMAVQEGTPSDMFRCGKCGKNDCTYNQMQTRSADEPMTTFVFCRSCGNRWKFC